VKALIDDQAATPDRSRRRRGSILFMSSLHDRYIAREAHYSVSKAGVAMLVQAMAKELGRHRIRVNAISPGWIRTAEDVNTPEQGAKEGGLRPAPPAGPAGPPADVARVALFLLSDAWSGYVTGQNIAVDGGLSLHNFLDESRPPGGERHQHHAGVHQQPAVGGHGHGQGGHRQPEHDTVAQAHGHLPLVA